MVMSPTLSAELTAEMLKQRTAETEILLITVTHPSWADDIRMCSLNLDYLYTDDQTGRPVRGIVSRGKQYVYTGVVPTLPTKGDEAAPEASFKFSNIDRRHTAMLKLADTVYPRVTLELVSTLNKDFVEISYPEMEINTASWKGNEVTITLIMYTASREAAPYARFTKAHFPNLFAE